MQSETSSFAALINGVGSGGTWGAGDIIKNTLSTGNPNFYLIGYEWWNSFVFQFDISITVTSSWFGGAFNYIDDNNYYSVRIREDADTIVIMRTLNGSAVTIYQEVLDSIVISTAYTIKIIYSAGRIDLFWGNKHLTTIYDYNIL